MLIPEHFLSWNVLPLPSRAAAADDGGEKKPKQLETSELRSTLSAGGPFQSHSLSSSVSWLSQSDSGEATSAFTLPFLEQRRASALM